MPDEPIKSHLICSMCLLPIIDYTAPRLLPCADVFCVDCIRQMLRGESKCVVCREQFSEVEVRKIFIAVQEDETDKQLRLAIDKDDLIQTLKEEHGLLEKKLESVYAMEEMLDVEQQSNATALSSLAQSLNEGRMANRAMQDTTIQLSDELRTTRTAAENMQAMIAETNRKIEEAGRRGNTSDIIG